VASVLIAAVSVIAVAVVALSQRRSCVGTPAGCSAAMPGSSGCSAIRVRCRRHAQANSRIANHSAITISVRRCDEGWHRTLIAEQPDEPGIAANSPLAYNALRRLGQRNHRDGITLTPDENRIHRDRKMALPRKRKHLRKHRFCRAPTCCQMNPINTTLYVQQRQCPARHLPCARLGDASMSERTCSAPGRAGPLAIPTFTVKPLGKPGHARRTRMRQWSSARFVEQVNARFSQTAWINCVLSTFGPHY